MIITLLKNIIIITSVLHCAQVHALPHEFELKDGRKIKAEVIKYYSALGKVDLKREDGKIVKVKTDIFIPKDQKYIAEWQAPPAESILIPAGSNAGTDLEFELELPEKRIRHVGAKLGDGSVAIIGGFGNPREMFLIDKYLTKVETIGVGDKFRGDIEGIALPNGNALIVHGGPGEVYDYKTKRSYQTKNALTPDYIRWPTLTALSSGMILISGGDTAEFNPLSYWAIYDPIQNKFTKYGEMNQPRSRHTATELQDGQILIAGGSKGNNEYNKTAEILNLSTGQSKLLSSKMTMPRGGHAAVLLDSGRVLIVGSVSMFGTTSCELFNPSSKTFRSTVAMGRNRKYPILWKCGSDVLVVGGSDNSRVVEVFDEKNKRFYIHPVLLRYPRMNGFSVTSLNETTALVVGGSVNSGGGELNKVEVLSTSHILKTKAKKRLPTKRSSDRNVGALVQVYQDGVLKRELPIFECSVKKGDERRNREKHPIHLYLTKGVADCTSPRLEVSFSKACTYEERVNLLYTIGFGDIPNIRLTDDMSATEAFRWNAVDPESLLPTKEEIAAKIAGEN